MKIIVILTVALLVNFCGKSSFDRNLEINTTIATKYFKINTPSNNLSVINGNLIVSGIVSDPAGIAKVEVVVNGTPILASGIQNWSVNAPLVKAKNTIFARVTLQDNSIKEAPTQNGILNPLNIYWNMEKPVSPTTLEFYEAASANFIQNGSMVYISGGENNSDINTAFYKYDMSTPTVKPVYITSIAKRFQNQAVNYGGKMVLLGGWQTKSWPNSTSDEIEYVDINGSILKHYAFIEADRHGRSGTVMVGTTAYIICGWDVNKVLSSKIYTYDLTQSGNTFAFKKDIGFKLYSMQTFVYNNKIYIFGGFREDKSYNNQLIIYDPAANSFSTQDSPLKYHRCGASVVVKGDFAYILGGEHFDAAEGRDDWANQVEKLDIINLTSEELAPMPLRIGYMASALNGNDIYLFGGKTNDAIPVKNYILKYTPEK